LPRQLFLDLFALSALTLDSLQLSLLTSNSFSLGSLVLSTLTLSTLLFSLLGALLIEMLKAMRGHFCNFLVSQSLPLLLLFIKSVKQGLLLGVPLVF